MAQIDDKKDKSILNGVIVTFQLIKIQKSVLFLLRLDAGNTLKTVVKNRNFEA